MALHDEFCDCIQNGDYHAADELFFSGQLTTVHVSRAQKSMLGQDRQPLWCHYMARTASHLSMLLNVATLDRLEQHSEETRLFNEQTEGAVLALQLSYAVRDPIWQRSALFHARPIEAELNQLG